MSGVRKIEHAKLYVEDVERAVDFYTGVMGLTEVERRDGTVYLGCGLDSGYDLGVVEGGTGVEHVAVRVTDDGYEAAAASLAGAGVQTDELTGAEPGEERALRFELPSGVTLELAVVAETDYLHPAFPATEGRAAAVRDLDHANLASPDVEADASFLRDVLGFSLSDVRHRDGEWIQAFARRGDYHHDVALTRTSNAGGATLHHLGWELPSIDAIKRFADDLAAAGFGLEMGAIGRHQAGGCIFAYFRESGGNRFEVCTEMPTLDADTETGFHDADAEESSVSAWGDLAVPDSFSQGS